MNIIYKTIIFLFFRKLKYTLKEDLIIELPNRRVINFGSEKNAHKIKIIKIKALFRVFFFGISSSGYSYIKKEWETSHLPEILALGLRNINLFKSFNLANKASSLYSRVFSNFSSNTIKKSKEQIKFHYDLGNKFYSKWLDRSMTYSSGIFENRDISLEEAQINKFQSLIDLAKIKKNNKVLEIGCGWGGFIDYVKKYIGSDITGITISKEQFKYTQQVLKNSTKVELIDYRKINSTYDKIVSIEMFEAVGKKDWNNYFKVINTSLRQGGKAALQIITINEKNNKGYQYRKDFIQKYIFPGGMLPTKNNLKKLAIKNKLSFKEHKSFGKDYAKTLYLWRQDFIKNWVEIKKLGYDDKFKRLWEYYLCYCEVGFNAGTIDVSQFLLEKN